MALVEIESIENDVIASFGVPNEALDAKVSYIATGTMQLSALEEYFEDEIVPAVTSTLSDLLGIHPKDVVVTSVDFDTGEVGYEVSSDIFSESEQIQSSIISLSNDDIEELMQESLPLITIHSNMAGENIEVDISITLDGSDASNVRQARTDVETILENMGYDVRNFFFKK